MEAPVPTARYVLISPCRNEAALMRETLDSVLGQTVLPAKWVIVDDGSTDETPRILSEYARRYPWIAFMLASACYRMGNRRVVLGSLAMLWGWLKSYQRRALLVGERLAAEEMTGLNF